MLWSVGPGIDFLWKGQNNIERMRLATFCVQVNMADLQSCVYKVQVQWYYLLRYSNWFFVLYHKHIVTAQKPWLNRLSAGHEIIQPIFLLHQSYQKISLVELGLLGWLGNSGTFRDFGLWQLEGFLYLSHNHVMLGRLLVIIFVIIHNCLCPFHSSWPCHLTR